MLLIGPPGSGKTRRVLGAVEAAIRADRSEETLLLVPTSSMKHHLLNVLAGNGLLVPARAVRTMSEFVGELTPGARVARGAVETRLLREVLRSPSTRAFGPRSDSLGLCMRIAALMGEFWAAGADSLQVEPAARSPGQRAFLEVFREYEGLLRRLGLLHHNQRIAQAAARVREAGLGRIRQVLVDGFDRFTRQQEALLEALAEQADEIVLAMPEGLSAYPLQRLRPVLLPPPAGSGPATEVVRAASPREEIVEVARRILASGRPLQEHAVILRSPDAYLPVIREVFETLRIPFKQWARTPLADHGIVQHFSGWLRAIERRFPGEETAEALASPLTPFREAPGWDRLDFELRSRLPADGLDFFRDASGDFPAQARFLAGLANAASWPRRRHEAPRWSQELLALQDHVQRPDPPVSPGPFQRTCDWRETLEAQRALRHAIESTARLPEFKGQRVGFSDFTGALGDVLGSAVLSVRDQRHEVVHVLPAHEARQWSVPMAFVCGLVDGAFPRRHAEDLLFDDEDRAQLKARGIAIRTAADKAAEERFLFRIAASRATARLVLTHPQFDGRGKPVAASDLLAGFPDAEEAHWARPGDTAPPHVAPSSETLPPDLLAEVAATNRRFSVSGIRDFRQCPYLYFSGKTLKLRGRPTLPDRRLDGAAVGSIAHATLERWNSGGGPIGEVLDRVFRKTLAGLHLPESFRTEQLRLSLRSDLVRFAHEQGASMRVPEGRRAFFEDVCTYRVSELEARPEVRCRIDRFDLDEGLRCVVTDYKYASPRRVQELVREHLAGDEIQLMIYLAALEQGIRCEPGGMALCGIRGQTSYAGVAVDGTEGLHPVDSGELRTMLERARSETAGAVESILGGRIAVLPKRESYCENFCEYGGVCRVQWHRRRRRQGLQGSSSR